MYSTCLFCNAPLGTNEVLEEFPVGRRLAFDAAKGRLWVVCRKCERWNLSPLEERWEAIEAAERIFSGTRMRVSTDNIGLARHPEGLELVRIGQPQRPEFAAWRYGDQFGRRRKRALLIGGAAVGVLGTVAIVGVATGVIATGVLSQSGSLINAWTNGRVVLKLPTDEGIVKLRRLDVLRAQLRRQDGGELELTLGRRRRQRVYTGAEAERVAGLVLPKINSAGARQKTVQDAVREIEYAGGPESYLARVADHPPSPVGIAFRKRAAQGYIGSLPTPTKLALEMALHEEQERRALEGELKALELAWQEAEEIAGISDDLLLPESIRERLRNEE